MPDMTPPDDARSSGGLRDRYYVEVYRFVYTRVRDPAAAGKISAQVFAQAGESRSRSEEVDRPVAARLYRMAVELVARYGTDENR